MRAATRMMMLGNRAASNVNGQNYQSGDFAGMTARSGRESMTQRGGRNMDRMGGRYGGRDDDARRRYDRDDDDDDSGYGGDRAYTAGVAWSDQERDKKHHKNQHDKVDEHKAMEWVRGMRAADGSPMPKYKPEQAEQMRKAHCPECDEWEWFTAVNMMYADYSEAAKKVNANRDEFYALMAKAFLMDEDAGPDKLAKYMHDIPKK